MTHEPRNNSKDTQIHEIDAGLSDLHGSHGSNSAIGCSSMASTKLGLPPCRLTSLEAESTHVSGMPPLGKKVLSTSCILQLAYQSIGVVYGDVGTSPLYVFTSTFPDGLHPVHYSRDVLGSLSLIIYTLTLIPLIKYVCIVLWANDNGDGGTFALYSLICRGANVSLLPNQQAEDRELSFYKLKMPSRQLNRALKLKRALESSHCAKNCLLFMALLGTCMVIGDGVLTPAISVLSAVSGIQAATSKLHQNAVVILSILVLIALFSVQKFGTTKVGFAFAPVVLIWFICIGSIGLYNIIKYDPLIIRAFNPKCIYDYFHGNLKQAWISLGGIVLCIT
ncbi:hypothetical protein GOP47_0018585, partial [Adiantum capillus-veneris]